MALNGFGKLEFLFALANNIPYAVIRKVVGHQNFKRKKYNGKPLMGIVDGGIEIIRGLDSNKPFAVARFGDTELRTIVYTIAIRLGLLDDYPDYIKCKMTNNAGFFPAERDQLIRFGDLMLHSCQSIDVFAVWFNILEDYVIRKTTDKASYINLDALEPYWSSDPWSKSLEGKKVLVIHPFEDTINSQYRYRDKIFRNVNVLPAFTLKTLKAVQSIGGSDQFKDWFEALDWMYAEALKIEFDIAIIGCGAYGLPLAALLKNAGKQAIHMGGVTQILFGIRGQRWDQREEMHQFFNEYWVRPSEYEKPTRADQVEGGCYW